MSLRTKHWAVVAWTVLVAAGGGTTLWLQGSTRESGPAQGPRAADVTPQPERSADGEFSTVQPWQPATGVAIACARLDPESAAPPYTGQSLTVTLTAREVAGPALDPVSEALFKVVPLPEQRDSVLCPEKPAGKSELRAVIPGEPDTPYDELGPGGDAWRPEPAPRPEPSTATQPPKAP